MMKALSVRQPWAWALFNGKDVENRSWRTNYRGALLIHASKVVDRHGLATIERDFGVVPPGPDELTTGGIIGVVNIVDCVEWHHSRWFNGMYGFVFENATPLKFQRCKGALSLFDVDLGDNRELAILEKLEAKQLVDDAEKSAVVQPS